MHSLYTVQLKDKENTALNPKRPNSDVKNVMSIFLLAQFQLFILQFSHCEPKQGVGICDNENFQHKYFQGVWQRNTNIMGDHLLRGRGAQQSDEICDTVKVKKREARLYHLLWTPSSHFVNLLKIM